MKINFKFFLVLSLALVLLTFCQSNTGSQNKDDLKIYDVGQVVTSKAINGKVFNGIDVKELKSKYFFIHL